MTDGKIRLSFTFFVRAYSFFAVLFFLFGTIALIIGGPALVKGYEFSDPAIISAAVILRTVVIFFFGAGFVISLLLLIVKRRMGFIAYKRIIDRLSSDKSMSLNLNVSFPDRDEFGNLGRWLNKFMDQMRRFDKIKVERLRASQQKIQFLAEALDRGLLFLSSENKITYANSQFKKLLNIGEKTIIGLPIDKVVQNDQLINALLDLKDKPKDQVLDDLKLKSGDVVYKTKTLIVPIISSEAELMEIMVVFERIQKKVLQI
jgi:PAS domain-containing protein